MQRVGLTAWPRTWQVLIVPGFVTTKLEVWQGVNCSTEKMRCASHGQGMAIGTASMREHTVCLQEAMCYRGMAVASVRLMSDMHM